MSKHSGMRSWGPGSMAVVVVSLMSLGVHAMEMQSSHSTVESEPPRLFRLLRPEDMHTYYAEGGVA